MDAKQYLNNNYIVNELPSNKKIQVRVPGSKSITNRALLLAALAKGESKITNALFSQDSRFFLQCLQELGFGIEIEEDIQTVVVKGEGGTVPCNQKEIYVGSAGTAARFLTAMLSLAEGEYYINASEQMIKRPMEPLLKALEELGTRFEYVKEPFALPLRTHYQENKNECNAVHLNIDQSSQFLSALLMTSVMLPHGIDIKLEGNRKAKSYVGITIRMMQQFGCQVTIMRDDWYRVERGQKYSAKEYRVEPDISAACYFYAMAAITGNHAVVEDVHLDSMQGDIKFLSVLEQMGCTLKDTEEGILLTGPESGLLRGIDIDLSDCSDQTMTLAAIAPFADTPTRIRNVGHIRNQESDRIHAIITELRRMEIKCEEFSDGLLIYPGVPKASLVETYDDHRMAMAFAVTGTRIPGLQINNPGCCAKTFEGYFQVLDMLTNKS